MEELIPFVFVLPVAVFYLEEIFFVSFILLVCCIIFLFLRISTKRGGLFLPLFYAISLLALMYFSVELIPIIISVTLFGFAIWLSERERPYYWVVLLSITSAILFYANAFLFKLSIFPTYLIAIPILLFFSSFIFFVERSLNAIERSRRETEIVFEDKKVSASGHLANIENIEERVKNYEEIMKGFKISETKKEEEIINIENIQRFINSSRDIIDTLSFQWNTVTQEIEKYVRYEETLKNMLTEIEKIKRTLGDFFNTYKIIKQEKEGISAMKPLHPEFIVSNIQIINEINSSLGDSIFGLADDISILRNNIQKCQNLFRTTSDTIKTTVINFSDVDTSLRNIRYIISDMDFISGKTLQIAASATGDIKRTLSSVAQDIEDFSVRSSQESKKLKDEMENIYKNLDTVLESFSNFSKKIADFSLQISGVFSLFEAVERDFDSITNTIKFIFQDSDVLVNVIRDGLVRINNDDRLEKFESLYINATNIEETIRTEIEVSKGNRKVFENLREKITTAIHYIEDIPYILRKIVVDIESTVPIRFDEKPVFEGMKDSLENTFSKLVEIKESIRKNYIAFD